MIIEITTNYKWISDFSKIPVVGGIFLFIACFIPAVLATFFIQYLFPAISGDPYFGRILAVSLVFWNLILYLIDVKLRILFIPAWILFAAIGFIRWIFAME